MSFPVITSDMQRNFETQHRRCNTDPKVPELCGCAGRACRQMNKDEGANRALCNGCGLAEFAQFFQ